MRFIHISDPHLSSLDDVRFWRMRGKRKLGYLSWTRNRCHHHKPEVLDALQVAIAEATPDYIAVTGDLVQIGLETEFEQARRWLERLQGIAPVLLVPGNHDVYQNDSVGPMFDTWSTFFADERPGAGSFPMLVESSEVAFVLVNSATPQPFWSAGGVVGDAQLARLETILQSTSDRVRCVLIHHPPLPGMCATRKGLRDVDKVASLLAKYGVELTLFGHVHRNLESTVGAHGRVLATASASNAGAPALSSYRQFDISVSERGTDVTAQLASFNAVDGIYDTIKSERWSVQRQDDRRPG